MSTIDILLPVRNGMPYFQAALDSLVSQTFTDWRALILDHGSTDGSVELAAAYAARDPRFVLLSFPQADGLSALLNYGLDHVSAPYIARHDADDISTPNRFERCLAYLQKRPHLAVVGTQAFVIDGQGKTTGTMDRPQSAAALTALAFFLTPIAHPTAMFRTSVVKALGVRYGIDFLEPDPKKRKVTVKSLAEDYFLFGQLALLGLCENLPERLLLYRWHGGNESSTKFIAQTTIALHLSQYMVKTYCAMHGQPCFDPAGMTTHGGVLIDFAVPQDLRKAFRSFELVLQATGLNHDTQVARELAYRHIFSTRSRWLMFWRSARFCLAHGFDRNAMNPAISWLSRGIKGSKYLRLNADGTLTR